MSDCEGSSCYAAELNVAVERWDKEALPRPSVVVVAGSGLSVDLGATVADPLRLADWLPFRAEGIAGHSLIAELLAVAAGENKPAKTVLYLRGRLHAYQGFHAHQVVFLLRLAALLGVRTAVITNASGGLYEGVVPGDLVLIKDHINLTGLNPLRGLLPSTWGPLFPDMIGAYDPALRRIAQELGRSLGIELREGVYLGLLGPSYETAAEIEAFRRWGADLVGMSTVLEVIAARQLGVRCLGLSLVTNAAAGVVDGTGQAAVLDHQDVLINAKTAEARVEPLLRSLLADPRF